MSKMIDLYLSGVFFQTLKYAKTRFLPGHRPGPAGVSYDAPSDPLVGWGGGHSLPIPFHPRLLQHLNLGASVVWPQLV